MDHHILVQHYNNIISIKSAKFWHFALTLLSCISCVCSQSRRCSFYQNINSLVSYRLEECYSYLKMVLKNCFQIIGQLNYHYVIGLSFYERWSMDSRMHNKNSTIRIIFENHFEIRNMTSNLLIHLIVIWYKFKIN